MRPFHAIAGVIALGLGLAGWATLGQAQPKPGRPIKAEIPSPRPKPIDDPFADTAPVVRPAKADNESATGPVRVLDKDPLELPDLPTRPTKTGPTPDAPKPAVRPAPETPLPEFPEPKAGGPAAREEPAVSLEWFGPTTLKVGAAAEYSVVARNLSTIPLHKVIVQVKVPAGAKVAGTEPKAQGTDAVLMWDLGTLAPRQETAAKMKIVPPAKGEMICQAWVTFTGSAAVKVQVREPKLQVNVQAPEKATIGDAVNVVLAVSNPGDHPAEAVKVVVALGTGLESAAGSKGLIEVGTLAAGETREVKVACSARTAGAHKCDVTVEGDGGLTAVGTATVSVLQPKLELEVTGPKLRYLERKAVYTAKVTNPGDAPATDVVVSHVVPAGFKFAGADVGGKYDPATKAVRWAVGEVGPGQAKELKCELVATGVGDFSHAVSASGARGVKAEKAVGTKVEGLSALGMEVADSDDPVEVGADTTYEIRVANTGSKDETDVKLVCTIPAQMKFKAADGPGRFEVVGGEVVFEPVKRLPARGDVIYKVTVSAKAKGDARFNATLTAGGLTEPVIRQESTRVYAD